MHLIPELLLIPLPPSMLAPPGASNQLSLKAIFFLRVREVGQGLEWRMKRQGTHHGQHPAGLRLLPRVYGPHTQEPPELSLDEANFCSLRAPDPRARSEWPQGRRPYPSRPGPDPQKTQAKQLSTLCLGTFLVHFGTNPKPRQIRKGLRPPKHKPIPL